MIIMLIRIRWQADDAEILEGQPLVLTPGLFITSGKLLAISSPVLSPRGVEALLPLIPPVPRVLPGEIIIFSHLTTGFS